MPNFREIDGARRVAAFRVAEERSRGAAAGVPVGSWCVNHRGNIGSLSDTEFRATFEPADKRAVVYMRGLPAMDLDERDMIASVAAEVARTKRKAPKRKKKKRKAKSDA